MKHDWNVTAFHKKHESGAGTEQVFPQVHLLFSTEWIRHYQTPSSKTWYLHSKARPPSRWPRPGSGWSRWGCGQTKHLSAHPCHLPCCTQGHIKNQLGNHTARPGAAGYFLHHTFQLFSTTPANHLETEHNCIPTLTHLGSVRHFISAVYNETGVLLLRYSSLEGTHSWQISLVRLAN